MAVATPLEHVTFLFTYHSLHGLAQRKWWSFHFGSDQFLCSHSWGGMLAVLCYFFPMYPVCRFEWHIFLLKVLRQFAVTLATILLFSTGREELMW